MRPFSLKCALYHTSIILKIEVQNALNSDIQLVFQGEPGLFEAENWHTASCG